MCFNAVFVVVQIRHLENRPALAIVPIFHSEKQNHYDTKTTSKPSLVMAAVVTIPKSSPA
jgi:hypothetical protein